MVNDDFILFDNLNISPSRVVYYRMPDKFGGGGQGNANSLANLLENTNKYKEISFKAKKRLQNAFDFMVYISQTKELQDLQNISKKKNTIPVKYKLNTITLTLPAKQKHDDKHIKKYALDPFLQSLRRKFNITLFIWKAERQENGNIHFHIITNKFIHFLKVRQLWNKHLSNKKLDYIEDYHNKWQEFYKGGFKMIPGDNRLEVTQRLAYEKALVSGWRDPNTTDIKAIKSTKGLFFYFSKYINKEVNGQTRLDRLSIMQDRLENWQMLADRIYGSPHSEAWFKKLDRLIEILKANMQILIDKGISGHIWNLSAFLSKLKSVRIDGDPSFLERMKGWKKNLFKTIEKEGCFSKIYIFILSIKKVPELKELLNQYIKNEFQLMYPDVYSSYYS